MRDRFLIVVIGDEQMDWGTKALNPRIVTGIALLAIGLAPVISLAYQHSSQYLLWFSNHTFLVMGIAVLLRLRSLATAELALGAIAELVYSVDMIATLVLGHSPTGITSYLFVNGVFDMRQLYSFHHLLFFPAALLSIQVLGGPSRDGWVWGLFHGLLIWGLSWAVGENLNCVREACVMEMPFYFLSWPLLMALQLILVHRLMLWCWPMQKD